MQDKQLTKNFSFILEKLDQTNLSDTKLCLSSIVEYLSEIEKHVFDNKDNISKSLYESVVLNSGKILEEIFKLISDDKNNDQDFYLKKSINDYFANNKQYCSMKSPIIFIVNERNNIAHSGNYTNKFFLNKSIEIQDELSFLLKRLHCIIIWFLKEILEIKDISLEENYFSSEEYWTRKNINIVIDDYEKDLQKRELDNLYYDFEINKFPIVSLLLKKDRKFNVPMYQRGYSWTVENIQTLIDDIKIRIKDNKIHYFGVIALKKTSVGSTDNIYKLIDGQQRLSTSLILLKVLRDINQKREFRLENDEQYNWIFRNDLQLHKIFYNAMQDDNENHLFNEVLELNHDVLEKSYSKNKTKCIVNYFELYRKINKEIDFYSEQKESIIFFTDFVDAFCKRFQIGIISFSEEKLSPKQELEIFQNINSKGKDLELHELIKNLIINLCSEEVLSENENLKSGSNRIVSIYSRTMKWSDESSENDKLNNFYKSFCHYASGEEINLKGNSNSLNHFEKSLKNILSNRNIKNKNIDLKDFEKIMILLSLYLKGFFTVEKINNPKSLPLHDAVFSIFNTLNYKKRSLIIPLIYLIIEIFSTTIASFQQGEIEKNFNNFFNDKDKAIFKCIETLTIYILIEFLIHNKGDSETKRIIYKEIFELRKEFTSFDNKTTLEELNKKLIEKFLNHNYLSNNKNIIRDSLYSSDSKEDWLFKSVLLLIEYKLSEVPKGQSVFVGRNTKITLEHIMPQNIPPSGSKNTWKYNIKKWNNLDSEQEIEEQHKKHLSKIGNLTLLNNSVNSTMKNDSFEMKQHQYNKIGISHLYLKKENFNYDFSIQDKKEWSFQIIDERSKQLVNYFIDVVLNCK